MIHCAIAGKQLQGDDSRMQFYRSRREGLNVIAKLLEGSQFKRSDFKRNIHSFIKYGNYNVTLTDFNSVGPSDVKELKQPYGLTLTYGRVRDVQIMIYKTAVGRGGLMKIFQEKKGSPEYLIEYTDDTERFYEKMKHRNKRAIVYRL